MGAPRLLRGPAEAVYGRLGPDGDGGRSERRCVALPGGVDDPGARVRQRPRASAGVDLERVRRVRALPGDGLDAGAMPDVPARTTGGGLGRLPLPGAAAHGRCRGHGSGLPVLGASRPRRLGARVGADGGVRLSHDEAAGGRLNCPAAGALSLPSSVLKKLTLPVLTQIAADSSPARCWRTAAMSRPAPVANVASAPSARPARGPACSDTQPTI